MLFAFEKTPCMSFSCKLVPVQYREYEYGLLDVMLVACPITLTNWTPLGPFTIINCQYKDEP